MNANTVNTSTAPAAAPAMRTITFTATVDLKDDSGSWGGVCSSHWEQINQWYHDFTDGIVDEMQNLRLELVSDGVVRFTYDMPADCDAGDDDINNSMLADPDDDGNYPITLDGTLYIVMGFVQD